jgi:transcriptional regulator with XRE-family HTH domain
MISIEYKTPVQILQDIGLRAKSARLRDNMSRKTLAEKAGVSEASLKRFETTGQVSLSSLVQLLMALDRLAELDELLAEQTPLSVRELNDTQRQRGRK